MSAANFGPSWIPEPKEVRGSVVIRQVDHRDRIAPSLKRIPTGAESKALVVVSAGNMGEEKMSDRHRESLLQIDGQCLVGEMTQAASHSLFQCIRVGSLPKHIHVMIGLDQDRLRPSERFFHRRRHVTDVRDMGKPELSLPDRETYRFRRIVRRGEDVYHHLRQLQAAMGFQAKPFYLLVLLGGTILEAVKGAFGGEERCSVLAGESQCRPGVVVVLMRE